MLAIGFIPAVGVVLADGSALPGGFQPGSWVVLADGFVR
jgi:hypothetical protein